MVRQRFAQKNPDGQMIPLILILHQDQEFILLKPGGMSHLSVPGVRHPSRPNQPVSFGKGPRREEQDQVLDTSSLMGPGALWRQPRERKGGQLPA